MCAQTAVGISVHKRELLYAFRSYQGYAKLRLVVPKALLNSWVISVLEKRTSAVREKTLKPLLDTTNGAVMFRDVSGGVLIF